MSAVPSTSSRASATSSASARAESAPRCRPSAENQLDGSERLTVAQSARCRQGSAAAFARSTSLWPRYWARWASSPASRYVSQMTCSIPWSRAVAMIRSTAAATPTEPVDMSL